MTKDFGSYSAPKDVHHSPPRFTNPSWGNALTLHTDLMQKAHFYAFLTNRQSIVPKTEKCVEKDRKVRYALKCPRSNTWLILDAIESKAPKKNSSKMTNKIYQHLLCPRQMWKLCGKWRDPLKLHTSWYASIVHRC